MIEYCRGGSIGGYMKMGNRFMEGEIREIASCCLLGLQCLHKKGIINRVGSLKLNE